MQPRTILRIGTLALGDVVILYASLFLMLLLRYGGSFYAQFIDSHFMPFTIIFAFWLLIFYISGLYDIRHLHNTLEFVKNLNLTIAVSAALTVLFFYLVPFFGITPKTNLFIFLIIFAILEIWWRKKFNTATTSADPPNKVLLIDGGAAASIDAILSREPYWIAQLGYTIVARTSGEEVAQNPEKLRGLVEAGGINLVVVHRKLKSNPPLARALYELMSKGVEVRDLPNFYELIARKVPLADLEETWFLENVTGRENFYDPLKRVGEFLAAFVLGVVLLPLELVIAVLVKLTSKGPIIYKQTRVGRGGQEFTLYKFRTMKVHNSHAWPGENDARITKIGRILRKAHLDELPQLINIIKGDISVVGPRPDFIDFYKKLEKEIPYYSIRTLIRPELTG
ncbi:MAG: sugar transferase, partial [bacterium]